MLAELDIANFAVIDHLRLALAPGLNVLTGETGAGKSIIIDALGLLLGGRGGPGMIRSGSDRARVEGIFEPGQAHLRTLAEGLGIDTEDGTLILSRELGASGRSTCRINGRAFPLRAFQEAGERLVDIHGQSEHLSLLRVREHVELLDRFGGMVELRGRVEACVRALRAVRRDLSALRQGEREVNRRIDLLAFQVREIAGARLDPYEEESLGGEHALLANAEEVARLSAAAYDALYGAEDRGSALDLVGEATQALRQAERLDPGLSELRAAAESAGFQLEDLARSLRAYRDRAERDPARLVEVVERLDVIEGLKRKYGSSLEEVMAFGRRAEEELAALHRQEERSAEREAEQRRLLAELGSLAAELSARRRDAGHRLAAAVEEELAGLGMGGTRVAVRIRHEEAPDGVPVGASTFAVLSGIVGSASRSPENQRVRGPERLAFDGSGVDRVEFLIAPNPGEPLRPLAGIASGGETSRLMLALKGVLSQADPVPTLVFDEIDAGIGGRIGEVVGQRLWQLGRRHQVLAVSHLPQVACYGDLHLQVTKQVADSRTVTRVAPVDNEDRVRELTLMLGSQTEPTRRKAAELLEQAEATKQRLPGGVHGR